ncbi:MAG TPA: bifunctional DNA-formamidopyrimidine glycosylase/DNA-(apurinic or apyrimidinic site) lyase [Syntrophomonadaceae bacterium]|nr:bifunctional DNA-formamidopyrimidine glycosylase/DNA-(apurinic or apyrimidinic site) lyase [Syntrophomonadaceae bacterium]HRX21509.1 bifunctional DNA-formamidopyrimidine glycosylase/DNA-(apurinic or apyrimidinic site) lyase [Syntrophomonadaceae bacterium]
MPELPEVESVRRSLIANQGAKIKAIELNREDIVRRHDFAIDRLQDKNIREFSRRGKYLILNLGPGYNLIIHLGMSGRFYQLNEDSDITAKHVHAVIWLDNGKKLVYEDPRRFGGLYLIKNRKQFFNRMGVEPLTKEFTPAYLHKITRNRKIAIKSFLLSQNQVCGIGNIYADESLHLAGIRPDRPAGSLTAGEAERLCQAIKKVLQQSIDSQGTTFRDYRNGLNQEGGNQSNLQVYGKDKEQCPNCGEVICKQTIGGRGTHFCEKCQK